MQWRGMWTNEKPEPDERARFEGVFESPGPTVLRLYASCPFQAWVDGARIGEGPPRFALERPEYSEWPLEKGASRIVVEAHYEGVETRLMPATPPFVACAVFADGAEVPVRWTAASIGGYWSRVRRINPQLGWATFARAPEEASPKEPVPAPILPTPPTRSIVVLGDHPALPASLVGEGRLRERFGYGNDDPPAAFFLRDLAGGDDGVWRRYDLGRVRLGRFEIALDLPRGTAVEVALSESLTDGRVAPWLTLSTGLSCTVDRFVAKGGPQTFVPSAPRSGRFVEVHVLEPLSPLGERGRGEGRVASSHQVEAESPLTPSPSPPEGRGGLVFRERAYHGAPEGSFRCSDPLLDRIWSVGVETYRACAEDAIVDNPSRERGQWMGDALTVGLEIAAVAYSDLALVRRALVQAAQGARGDGLAMGLGPGTPLHMPTYALYWADACLRYARLTGDPLPDLWPAAERNAALFLAKAPAEVPGWSFVDWGAAPEGSTLDLIVCRAMRSMASWAQTLGKDPNPYGAAADRLAKTKPDGFHAEALALALGLRGRTKGVKSRYRTSFPNDKDAPPLSNPSSDGSRVVTPFFAHWALDGLWQAGEGDFALDQYRSLWGWALGQGLTTWPEVFDLRWSHCHSWSGCPTWQLTRHVLGLSPRRDLGPDVYDADPKPCALAWAEGHLPDGVRISREGNEVEIAGDRPIRLRIDGKVGDPARLHHVSA